MVSKIVKALKALAFTESKFSLISYLLLGKTKNIRLADGSLIYLPKEHSIARRFRYAFSQIYVRYIRNKLSKPEFLNDVVDEILEGVGRVHEVQGKYLVLTLSGNAKIKVPLDTQILLRTLYTLREVWKLKVYGDPPKGVVIDIGAFIGDTALYFALKADKVVAIEPNDEFYNLLLENIRLNGLQSKVITFKTAIKSRQYPDGETLSTILNLIGKADLIKIDCEGCEHEIVDEFKVLKPKVKAYAIECHETAGDCARLINILKNLEYRVKLMYRSHNTLILYATRT